MVLFLDSQVNKMKNYKKEPDEIELEKAISRLATDKNKAQIIKSLIEKEVNISEKQVKFVTQFYKDRNMSRLAAELAEKAAYSAKKAGFDEKAQKIFLMTIKLYEEMGLTYRWYTSESMEKANEIYHAAVRMYELSASKYGNLEKDSLKKIALLAKEAGLIEKESDAYKKILKSKHIDSSWIDKEIGYENIEKAAEEALAKNHTGLVKLLFEHYENAQKFGDAERLAKHLGYKDKTDVYRILKGVLD